jgi:hypothetical protein
MPGVGKKFMTEISPEEAKLAMWIFPPGAERRVA